MYSTSLALAYQFIRWWVSSGLFDRIAELVLDLTLETIPGNEKKQRVIQFVQAEGQVLVKKSGAFLEIAIDLIIAAVRITNRSDETTAGGI